MRGSGLLGCLMACAALWPPAALADPAIDAGTQCRAIVDYLNKKDSPHAQEAYRAAQKLMGDLDAATVAKGGTSLLTPLTKDHVDDIYLLVIESCRDYPQQTLGQTASDTYDGLVDLRDHPPSGH